MDQGNEDTPQSEQSEFAKKYIGKSPDKQVEEDNRTPEQKRRDEKKKEFGTTGKNVSPYNPSVFRNSRVDDEFSSTVLYPANASQRPKPKNVVPSEPQVNPKYDPKLNPPAPLSE